MTVETRLRVVAFILIAGLTVVGVALLVVPPDDPQVMPAAATPPTVFTVTNLPPPLTAAAVVVVSTPALRAPAIQLTEPPPAPSTTTIPLEPCDELRWYRTAAGLPARFDALGYRESRCGNNAISRTGCCVGWWQIHWINFDDHRTQPGLTLCDATWHNIRGDTPEAKQRQACAAKVIYDIAQYTPWAL